MLNEWDTFIKVWKESRGTCISLNFFKKKTIIDNDVRLIMHDR